jgi:hypothetical protein
MRGRMGGMSESLNEQERQPVGNVPEKDPPIIGLWPIFLVANIVSGGFIYWHWKDGTFWTGRLSGYSLLIAIIVIDLLFLYCAIRDRINQQ